MTWGRAVGGSGPVGASGNHEVLFQDGEVIDLDAAERSASLAHAINPHGQIVGTAGLYSNQVALWEDGARTLLGPGVATAINAQEWIVGSDPQESNHAFLYRARVRTDLGVLPGGFSSLARGVNEDGQVVGSSRAFRARRAFLWQADTGMVDLNDLIPTNSGWQLEYARGINNVGQITGWGHLGVVRHSFLLTPAPPAR